VTVIELSVSVIAYRTPVLLKRCLEALEAERSSVGIDVTVIDNASGDGSADMVADQFPWVRIIRNRQNVGFGAAHNQALRHATGRYWLVLNSDAAPRPGALRVLVDFLQANPRVAVAGPRLRYPDGTVQPSRRRFPTVATLFVESTQIQRFIPRNPVLQRYYLADRSDDEPQDVDWLVGACLCVRAAAAAEVGLFDESFFMYSEELDWCRRFRAAGWRVAYVPSAEVVHLEGGSSRLDLVARDRMFQASKLRYAAKWHGRWVAHALRAYLVLEYVARGMEEGLKLALGSRVPERRARLRVIGSGLRATLRG
jgi:N-acetylglucosaminyl-diphospho-decaprenol L-rhamnosyltransferase